MSLMAASVSANCALRGGEVLLSLDLALQQGTEQPHLFSMLGEALFVLVQHIPVAAQGGRVEELGLLQNGEAVVQGVIVHGASFVACAPLFVVS
jgi:hypothetical protein